MTLLTILLQSVSWSDIQKQGPLFTALLVAIIYFYKRQQVYEASRQAQNDKYDALIKENADKLEKYLTEDRETLIKVLENNNQVMQDNTVMMQSFREFLNAQKK